MPTSDTASLAQQRRWEAGKLDAARRWVPRLIRDGLREHDIARLHAAFDLLVPPQSLLAGLNVVGAVAACVAGSSRQRRLAFMNLGAHAAFVLVGLRVANAPRGAYASLVSAPALAARKAGLYTRLLSGESGSWQRTHR